MKLYLQIKNGNAVNHPALEENLLSVFGKIPEDWVEFKRITQPSYEILPVDPYQIPVCEYALSDDGTTWEDKWSIRNMTEEEKTQKINDVVSNKPYASWIFNEEKCIFDPPIPYPKDEKHYYWNEQNLTWVEIV